MAIYKKGSQSSDVIIATVVYTCTECDHVQMSSGDEIKKCPVCDADMVSVSGSGEKEED